MKPHTPKSPLTVISAINFCAGTLFVLACFPAGFAIYRWFQGQVTPPIPDYPAVEAAKQAASLIEFSAMIGSSITLVIAGVFVKAVAHILEILWGIYTNQMSPK